MPTAARAPASEASSGGPKQELEILMSRYQRGDADAATELVRRLSPQIYRFFTAHVSSRSDADDLLQETWLRIHSARQTYQNNRPVLPWVYAIARHIRLDHSRVAQRSASREQQLENEPVDAASLGVPHTNDRMDLKALLAPLPESQREVIQMLKISGMSIEEVARATSSTVGSVKQKAHRAYQSLRKRMKRQKLNDECVQELP
jgi:RNA polymerase sigma-70 factor (ECF subfamily)